MVFLFLPVGSVLRAGRALSQSSSKASKAVDSAFSPSSTETAPPPPPPPPATSYVAPDGSASVLKWKPRLIARDDGIEVDPRDVHLLSLPSAATGPPSPRSAVGAEDVELQEKKTDSTAAPAGAAAAPGSSEPYYLYYRLLDADSHVYYSSRLEVGDNHPDIGCQLCTADERGDCPCLSSCGFDIRFDANVNTVTVLAPPSAAAPPPPAPAPTKSGIKGFMATVARKANETILAERMQSQQITIAYQQTQPRVDQPPSQQVMELNAVQPFHFRSEHTDCLCLVVWLHVVSKVQKSAGMQIVALPKQEGDAMAAKCTWYTCTAC